MDKNKKISEEKYRGEITELIEEGKKYIYPQLWEMWEKQVEGFASKEIFNGDRGVRIVKEALKIMRLLDQCESMENLKEYTRDLSSEFCTAYMLVREFSKRGPEFHRALESYNTIKELSEECNKKETFEKLENMIAEREKIYATYANASESEENEE